MAGMLPGVESARRRRFHQTGGGFSDSIGTGTVGSTRRSSFCLYSSNFASHNSFTLRNTTNQTYQDEELGGVARVAKDRLDERLRAQWKSDAKRIDARNNNGTEEMIGLKNKRLKWGKLILGWKLASSSSSSSSSLGQEQEDCAICLEGFKVGEIMQIACGHRFHSGCLVPWLDANAHCPCCRMGVIP